MAEKQFKFKLAQNEWDERNGSYLIRAKNWRFFALLSAGVSLLAVAGVIYIGSQSKIQPYIVTIDKIGTPISAIPVPNMKVDERIIRYALADFITSFRTVYPDITIQKQYVANTYKYLANFPANAQITQIYRSNPPINQKESIKVEVSSVLNLGKDQYQIDWKEQISDNENGGAIIRTNSYRGIVVITIIPPTNDVDVTKNPIGLYVKDISFQKTLNN